MPDTSLTSNLNEKEIMTPCGPDSPLSMVVVLTTAPDELLAKRIAHVLVEEGLAACVNLSAAGLSMYSWQGVLEGESEHTLTIKTSRSRIQALAARIKQLHPYEVPEILVLDVAMASDDYLQWVHNSLLR